MTEDRNAKRQTLGHLAAAAAQFKSRREVLDIREHGHGNVHDTFLVTLKSEGEEHFLLQRVNTHVFRQPELVMRNMRTFTEHARKRFQITPLSEGRRWETPRVLLADDGQDHWLDPEGAFWRAMSFIEAAQSFDTIQDVEHAREVGAALGMFHHLITDLPVESLVDTPTGFHITPCYLRRYATFCNLLAKSRPEVGGGSVFPSFL